MGRLTVSSALSSSIIAILLIACSDNRRTAWDNLVYKEEGLTRAEFLPCAAEMIKTMDKLDAHMDAALKGDQKARAEAQNRNGFIEEASPFRSEYDSFMTISWSGYSRSHITHQVATVIARIRRLNCR
jgi:hypothetical protein